jgi:hypothetical protein
VPAVDVVGSLPKVRRDSDTAGHNNAAGKTPAIVLADPWTDRVA